MPDITRRLAHCLVATTRGSIPADVRHEATRSLVNWLGCAPGGCRDSAVDIALSALREFAGPPQATLLDTRWSQETLADAGAIARLAVLPE